MEVNSDEVLGRAAQISGLLEEFNKYDERMKRLRKEGSFIKVDTGSGEIFSINYSNDEALFNGIRAVIENFYTEKQVLIRQQIQKIMDNE